VAPYFFGLTQLIPKTELASTLENSTLFQKKPEYRKALQVVSVPERVVQFRVVWEDDNQQVSHSFIRHKNKFQKI
jgi:glutamate dehydrogenase/leucine dehydrogenase